MAPNISQEPMPEISDEGLAKLVAPQAGPRQYKITWSRVFVLAYMHIAAVYGAYLLWSDATWPTVVFSCMTFYMTVLTVFAGTHRLWSHNAYKATKPLQIFLMLGHCMSMPHSIFFWVKDHRLHHRYSETDGDPFNATRGILFSHIGWICVNRHPELHRRGRLVDMTDMSNNPIVMFQKRHKIWLNTTMGFIVPILIPLLWKESLFVSFHANAFRLMFSWHGFFTINSLGHMFGSRPYDKNIGPTQNVLANVWSFGEGFHNYHHSFPYDYKAGEFGSYFNWTTSFIDFCAKLGLAYDMKEVSKEVLEQRMARTGDGSNDKYGLSFVQDMISSYRSSKSG